MQRNIWVLLSIVNHCLFIDIVSYVEEGENPKTYLGDCVANGLIITSLYNATRNFYHFYTHKNYTTQMLDIKSICTFNKLAKYSVRGIIKNVIEHQPEIPDKQIIIGFSERRKKNLFQKMHSRGSF